MKFYNVIIEYTDGRVEQTEKDESSWDMFFKHLEEDDSVEHYTVDTLIK